jgi:sugar-specific transcriptional regulator TrmB
MHTDELTEILKEAGLSPYQADAYVTLLSTGATPAQELATASEVPGPRIYDVLEALEEQGYIITYERDQLYAEAVDPTHGLEPIDSRVSRFTTAKAEIRSRWKEPATRAIDISVVKQFQTVLEHTRERIIGADHQILLALTYDQFLRLESALTSAVERGVFVQVSIHFPRGFDADDIDTGSFPESASEVRLADVPAMYEPFLSIIDGSKVSFAPFNLSSVRQQGDTAETDPVMNYGVLADDPIHAYVFEWYFLAALWEPSEPVYTARNSTLPMEFIDIREVIRAVDPLLRDGATVKATVRGRVVATGRQVSMTGEITSVKSDKSASPDGQPIESLFTRQATIVLETDEGEVSVGGWGAYSEDLEAERIVITDIDK